MLKLRTILLNSKAAIDLASIMVGIIVIGLIGGVIAATVFAVIPWAQDSAAKQQLESIHTAQNAAYGFSADPSRALPEGQERNSFTNSDGLERQGLLTQGESYCTAAVGKDDYRAYSKSSAGKVWFASNGDKQAKVLTAGTPGLVDCAVWVEENVGVGNENPTLPGDEEEQEDPETQPTIYGDTRFLLNCPTDVNGLYHPFKKATGTLTVVRTDNQEVVRTSKLTPSGTTYTSGFRMAYNFEANVEYELIFDGTFEKLQNGEATTDYNSTAQNNCYRKMTAWATDSETTSADNGFRRMTNLTEVPRSIPTTVTDFSAAFLYTSASPKTGLATWDVSNVDRMVHMFGVSGFNEDISGWDVSNVTNMQNMFSNTTHFNQDISGWNVSNVTNMGSMFFAAKEFNQDISGWNVDKVTAKTNFRLNSALTDENTPAKLR